MTHAKASSRVLRSQPTRDRILASARHIFARQGYDRTTIRAIAARAKINPAMVIRYYGSKEQLFATVATLDFEAAPLVTLPPDQIGEAMVRHVLDRWEHPQTGAALAAMLRAAVASEPARKRLTGLFAAQLAQLFAALGPSQRAAAPLIASQMLGLTLTRYVLKLPDVVAMPKEVMISKVGRVVQDYLDGAGH